MKPWQNRLFHASRSRSFLWKFALAAIAFGLALGLSLSQLRPSRPYLLGERVLAAAGLAEPDDDDDFVEPTTTAPNLLAAFAAEVKSPVITFAHVVRAIPLFAPFVATADHQAFRETLRLRFGEELAGFALDYLGACNPANASALTRLKARADEAKPARYVRYSLGLLHLKRKDYTSAYHRFRAEADDEHATESREMAVYALAKARNFRALEALVADARFAPYLDAQVKLEMAVGLRQWSGILKGVTACQLESYRHPVSIVAAVGGLAWALFLLNLGEIPRLRSATTLLCALGFVAGVISTIPTVFLVLVEDEILQFAKGHDVYHSFAYFIAGVGVREELCKLLLFVPFLPILIRRGNDLEALIVACFVGLGFATEENGGYFVSSAAASAPGRFLTANFFHIALTGLNGLALFRTCVDGVRGLNQLLVALPVSILVHGAYDALLETPDLDGAGFFAMTVYIAFALYFFRTIHPLRSDERRTVSLTGSFVFGISVLSATVIAFQMATLGATAGMTLIFSELMSSAVLLVLFFREFNEPLTP